MPDFSNTDLVYLRAVLRNLAGLSLGPDKDYLFDTRLDSLCRKRNLSSGEFMQRLAAGEPEIEQDFVDFMTTQETFFFRDLKIFELLKTKILPEIIERNRRRKRLAIWSAGCANGQEPYSIAMLISSYFPFVRDWDTTILATDVSRTALRRAQSGSYSQNEVNRGLPVRKLLRYFRQQDDQWKILDSVASLVDFRNESLLSPNSQGMTFDLILCRNVLIYFDTPTKTEILKTLHRCLDPDGYLLLGGAERIFSVTEDFEPRLDGSLVYYSPSPHERTKVDAS